MAEKRERPAGTSRLLLAAGMSVTRQEILEKYKQDLLPEVQAAAGPHGVLPVAAPAWTPLVDDETGTTHLLGLEHVADPTGEAAFFDKANKITVYTRPAVAAVKRRIDQRLTNAGPGTHVDSSWVTRDLHEYLESALTHEWKHARDYLNGVQGIAGAAWLDPTELDAYVEQVKSEIKQMGANPDGLVTGTPHAPSQATVPHTLDRMFHSFETTKKVVTQDMVDSMADLFDRLKAAGVLTVAVRAAIARLKHSLAAKWKDLDLDSW